MHATLWPLLSGQFAQMLAPCMSLQSFGVSHMKLGADAEFRSFMRAQSVTAQVLGFALIRLLHRAELFVMS